MTIFRLYASLALIAAWPLYAEEACAEEVANSIRLVHGHPLHDRVSNQAGIAMGLSITGAQADAMPLLQLCSELQAVAGLDNRAGDDLELRVVFIVPYKDMAVEGYYLPASDSPLEPALVPGNRTDRAALDSILARAGISPQILDEADVEQEISCQADAPVWTVSWQDLRPIGTDRPEEVIASARDRFLEIYRTVARGAATAAAGM